MDIDACAVMIVVVSVPAVSMWPSKRTLLVVVLCGLYLVIGEQVATGVCPIPTQNCVEALITTSLSELSLELKRSVLATCPLSHCEFTCLCFVFRV